MTHCFVMLTWSFIFFFVYVFDFLTKSIVRARMPVGSEIKLLPFFSLTHVQNTGIAFGMFQRQNFFFVCLGLIVIGAVIFYSVKLMREDRVVSFVLAGVLGGALGNLTDRVFFGHVTDFLDFFIGVRHWPAFNVADSAISVGACLLLWRSLKTKSPMI